MSKKIHAARFPSSCALCDFNARGFKADKKTHIFCLARATVNTKRNEIKRKVNRWRGRAQRERESKSSSGRGRTQGKEAEKFAAGDLATRIPQSVDHSRRVELSQCIMGENTVTAKSCASTRKAYIRGTRFITRLTRVIERFRSKRDPTSRKVAESIRALE